MRLNVNLATQPYEDSRRFLALWSGILGALLLMAVVLSYAVVTRWQQHKFLSANIVREKQILADFQSKQQQDLAILNKPENQDVRDRSDFLNELIRRKEVSWTKIFMDLESMMPAHLRVLAVEPQLHEDQILVTMQLGGDSRDRAAELVRRMEKSKTFRYAQVVAETDTQPVPGEADPMRFQITAEYVPAADEPAPSSAKSAKAETTGGGQ